MLESKTKSIEAIEVREYAPGEIIVKEGTSNEFFYVILQGEVPIDQLDKYIRILKDRDVFGLGFYYRICPYSTTAKALQPS
ncbi:MAG: hypothetical protein DRG37_06930, partial [Deltaproteobacteria bacterium]